MTVAGGPIQSTAKNTSCESTIFHFKNPPFIRVPLFSIMSSVDRFSGELAATGFVRFEDLLY